MMPEEDALVLGDLPNSVDDQVDHVFKVPKVMGRVSLKIGAG